MLPRVSLAFAEISYPSQPTLPEYMVDLSRAQSHWRTHGDAALPSPGPLLWERPAGTGRLNGGRALCSCPRLGSDLERETRTEGKRSFCSNPLSSGSSSRLGGPCMQMSQPILASARASPCPLCPSDTPTSAGPSPAGCDRGDHPPMRSHDMGGGSCPRAVTASRQSPVAARPVPLGSWPLSLGLGPTPP